MRPLQPGQPIVTYDGDLAVAHAPMSVAVTLEDEIDISRGDMLVPPHAMPHASRRLEATVVWMHAEPLETNRPYVVKHTSRTVRATVTRIVNRIDVNTLAREDATRLELNEIGTIAIETHKPLFFDAYRNNRLTGSFILIDPVTNATVGAGMVLERQVRREERTADVLAGAEFERSRLTPAERYARAGHNPATIWLTARLDAAYLVERLLFDRGCLVHVLADDVDSHLLPELARICAAAGLITVCSNSSEELEDRERARALSGPQNFLAFDPEQLPANDFSAAQQICRELENRGIIPPDSGGLAGDGI